MSQAFEIIYDSEVSQHLKFIERKYHGLIRQTIEQQLSHEPLSETRNRKPLVRASAWDKAWELRLGPNNRFRVFYRTFIREHEVHVLAIGVKVGSRLNVGGGFFSL